MKKITLILALAFISFSTFAQNAKFQQAMGKTLGQFAAAQSIEELQVVANQFERIAGAETSEWLGDYYIGFSYMRMAGLAMRAEKMDDLTAYLDKAQAAMDHAKTIAPNESEVHAMQGYVYMGRIWENPMVNGAQYSPMANIAFGKAEKLNPENPRVYFLKGQLTFFTPAFWGGGAETALPILQKANEKYTSFESASPLHPSWGSEENTALLKQAEATVNGDTKTEDAKGE